MGKLFRIYLLAFCLFFTISVSGQESTPEVPPATPLIDTSDHTITNFLLLGTALENPDNPGLTDAMLVVSLNQTLSTISILSIPRDIQVYIPNVGHKKINQAYLFGSKDADTTGINLLKQTITYNLGINIDYYVRVNFSRFKDLIDALGGITITVDCAIEDWRLKEPDLDKDIADNWELFILWAGVHYMDGDLALWYARSRRTSNDLDRGRRQQDLLRAIWHRIQERGILQDLPTLWQNFTNIVDTDLTLGSVLSLLPYTYDLNIGDLTFHTMRVNEEIVMDKDAQGSFIFTIQQEAMQERLQQMMMPSQQSLSLQRPTVAFINGSGIPGMARIAADRLELEGFRTVILNDPAQPTPI